MTMSLASCLPDFTADEKTNSNTDTSEKIAANNLESPASQLAAPFRKASATKLSQAKLHSVVRQIRLVETPAATSLTEAPPPINIEALLKTHGEKVREEEVKKAQVAIAEAIANERKAFDEQIAAARARWVAEESAALAKQMVAAMQKVEGCLSGAVTRIFTPFLKEAIREKAITGLRQAVIKLLQDSNHANIEITGPADLIEAMKDAIVACSPENAQKVVFAVADIPDVRMVTNDIVCVTQLDAWNNLIEEALSEK